MVLSFAVILTYYEKNSAAQGKLDKRKSQVIDKQFLPDTPAILGGVVYVSIIISLVNLIVDLIYVALDPRIKARLKSQ